MHTYTNDLGGFHILNFTQRANLIPQAAEEITLKGQARIREVSPKMKYIWEVIKSSKPEIFLLYIILPLS